MGEQVGKASLEEHTRAGPGGEKGMQDSRVNCPQQLGLV